MQFVPAQRALSRWAWFGGRTEQHMTGKVSQSDSARWSSEFAKRHRCGPRTPESPEGQVEVDEHPSPRRAVIPRRELNRAAWILRMVGKDNDGSGGRRRSDIGRFVVAGRRGTDQMLMRSTSATIGTLDFIVLPPCFALRSLRFGLHRGSR